MGKKQKRKTVYLQAPEGVQVRRHHIGGDNQEIRFTTPHISGPHVFDKLVGVAKNGEMTWIHKDFSN